VMWFDFVLICLVFVCELMLVMSQKHSECFLALTESCFGVVYCSVCQVPEQIYRVPWWKYKKYSSKNRRCFQKVLQDSKGWWQ